MNTYVAEYSSNNSGGSWWLSDDDWKSLEKRGWVIGWFTLEDEDSPFWHPGGRWLEALASRAYLVVEGDSRRAAEEKAIASFESAAHQDFSDEGCECCGTPHSMFTMRHKKFKGDKDNKAISARL